ncbi:hypothetical protein [Actinomyces israelii]|uniref:hypothetical protein n=1 Tax=Actinomyces israelii TaxID=1659 RepID=UPI0005BD4007|nr:hypothetical protein [Actinomyces israelii]
MVVIAGVRASGPRLGGGRRSSLRPVPVMAEERRGAAVVPVMAEERRGAAVVPVMATEEP